MNADYDGKFDIDLNPGNWPDGLPPCLIRVDKEGRMTHLGAPMIHEGINRLLMEHVRLDEKGRYIIEFNGQRCYVDVEDTFFVIQRLDRVAEESESFFVTLNDGTRERLDPSSLSQGRENVLYARVKAGRFPARFLRPSYYQLAEFIVEKNGSFVLPVGGRDYPIQ
ncbi:MAG: DUF1285 domain-containing protein [Proteobacteria bacterium]|nr:DUF1285 domain-containing protein [Pseudomonadota bacterium]